MLFCSYNESHWEPLLFWTPLTFIVCTKTVKTFVRISSFVLYPWVNYPFKLDNKCGENSRSLQARLEYILSISVWLMPQMVSEQAMDGLWVSRLSLRLALHCCGLCDCPAVLELTDQSVKILWEVELWQWVGVLGLSVTHNSFLQQPGDMICLCTQTDYRHTFTKIGSITEGVEIDWHNFDDNTSLCHKS